MQIQCKFDKIQCTSNADSIHIQCTFNAYSIQIKCNFNANSMHIQCMSIHSMQLQPALFYRFVVGIVRSKIIGNPTFKNKFLRTPDKLLRTPIVGFGMAALSNSAPLPCTLLVKTLNLLTRLSTYLQDFQLTYMTETRPQTRLSTYIQNSQLTHISWNQVTRL